MPSKRIYKEAKCANPACGGKYKPHDKRQKFCDSQCRTNYHNDKSQDLNRDRYFREKSIRKCDSILEMLFVSDFYKNEAISESILLPMHVDLLLANPAQHVKTGSPIYWFHAYGLELTDETKRLYTIHIRNLKN